MTKFLIYELVSLLAGSLWAYMLVAHVHDWWAPIVDVPIGVVCLVCGYRALSAFIRG